MNRRNVILVLSLCAIVLSAAAVILYANHQNETKILEFGSAPNESSLESCACTYQFVYTGEYTEYVDWSFGDGTYSKEGSPIHTFTEGKYDISCTAHSDALIDIKTMHLTVVPEEYTMDMFVNEYGAEISLFVLSMVAAGIALLLAHKTTEV